MKFTDFHSLHRLEVEHGFSQPIFTSGNIWTYKIDCKKFSSISNITLLFRGDEEEGLFSYLDKGTLFANGIEISDLESDSDDPRVCEFSNFGVDQPIPSFALETLEIKIEFLSIPPFERDMLRLIGDVTIENYLEKAKEHDWKHLNSNAWEYVTNSYKFIKNGSELSIQKTSSLYKNIIDIIDSSESEVEEKVDFDFGFDKSRLLSHDLDYYVNWKTQRKLLKKSLQNGHTS